MKGRLRDFEHQLRLLLLLAVGVGAFVVVRAAFVPEGFGEHGFYRSGALADNARRTPVHAGRQACAECHDDVVAARAGGGHAAIGCESCHGALAIHAGDPGAQAPRIPEPRPLCLGCHATNVARPAFMPQVGVEHGEGEACTACHNAHRPGMEEE